MLLTPQWWVANKMGPHLFQFEGFSVFELHLKNIASSFLYHFLLSTHLSKTDGHWLTRSLTTKGNWHDIMFVKKQWSHFQSLEISSVHGRCYMSKLLGLYYIKWGLLAHIVKYVYNMMADLGQSDEHLDELLLRNSDGHQVNYNLTVINRKSKKWTKHHLPSTDQFSWG